MLVLVLVQFTLQGSLLSMPQPGHQKIPCFFAECLDRLSVV